jgi:hypothetical protein
MTLSAIFVLFVLPLSLLLLGGLAVLAQERMSRDSTDTKESPTPPVSAEIESRLAEFLERSSGVGVALTVRDKNGRVQGVLLTRNEYELLIAVPGARMRGGRPDRFWGIGTVGLNLRILIVLFGTALAYTSVAPEPVAPGHLERLNLPLLLACLVPMMILAFLLRDRHTNPPAP